MPRPTSTMAATTSATAGRRRRCHPPPGSRRVTTSNVRKGARRPAKRLSSACHGSAEQVADVADDGDQEAQPERAPVAPSGRDLAHSALAMARLEGEIAKELDDYSKRPRRKFIGASAMEYRFAQYFEEWRQKVERVGTLNYPEAARGKLYGSLVLTVIIKSDGSVAGIEIDRSSGHKVLDDAARRIVAMAAPYAAFPPAIRHDTDVLEITRTWNFTRHDSLETKAAK
jgi:protein TonB